MCPSTQAIGNRGEELAYEYLLDNDYYVFERNFRYGRYEIDIIAFKDGVLHIVEVKTRKQNSLTSPEDAITPSKFNALSKAAKIYLKQNNFDYSLSFDLIAVEYGSDGGHQLRFIEGAMQASW